MSLSSCGNPANVKENFYIVIGYFRRSKALARRRCISRECLNTVDTEASTWAALEAMYRDIWFILSLVATEPVNHPGRFGSLDQP